MRISKPHGCKVKTLAETLGFNREICTSWKEFTNFHSKKFGASSVHNSWWGHRMNNTKNRSKWLVGSSESFLSTKIIMRPIRKDVYLCEKPWHRRSVQLFHKLLEGFECNAAALSIRIEVGQICLHQWTQVPHAGFVFLHLRLILWVSINFLKISKSKRRLDYQIPCMRITRLLPIDKSLHAKRKILQVFRLTLENCQNLEILYITIKGVSLVFHHPHAPLLVKLQSSGKFSTGFASRNRASRYRQRRRKSGPKLENSFQCAIWAGGSFEVFEWWTTNHRESLCSVHRSAAPFLCSQVLACCRTQNLRHT